MSSSDDSGITQSIANLSIIASVVPQEIQEQPEEQTTPRQDQFPPDLQQQKVFATEEAEDSTETSIASDIEREETVTMPSGSSSRHHSSSSSSKKHHSSSSSSKQHTKSDDWSDVTEPEERRRIQNRIAQRKFREKAREQKELQEREARNQELAGASYTIPLGSDLADEEHLSGLPWGGLNIPHMMQRGHASASQQGGSRRGGASEQYDSQQRGGQYYDPGQLSFGGADLGYGGYGGYEVGDDRYLTTSVSSSSPSYFSYDAFSGDGGSQTGSGTRR